MQRDAIWNRARSDLVITTKQGDQDVFLWEHSARVAESALRIAELPEVQSADPDERAIVAGALYHDAGWLVRLQAREITREEILVRPNSDDHREHGADMLERRLAKLLPDTSLERAAQAVRTLNNRDIPSIEGQVITEAHNLDEFGMVSIWISVRRGAVDGKGVQAVIDMWRRRKEFHFWTARLNSSFRFEPIRDLARRRLESLEGYMQELEVQHKCADLPPKVSV